MNPPCHNGKCVQPNVCKCLEGFEMDTEKRECQRLCHPACVFGECIDGRCECELGFQMVNGSEHICEPHCDKPCINGTCTDSNVCTPICLCVGGSCNEHNKCQCEAGFRLQQGDDGGDICEPICGGLDDNCVNGTCLPHGECLCFDGFEKSRNSDYICVQLGTEATIQHVVLVRGYTRYLYVVYIVVTGIAAVVFVLLIMRRHRKVDYSVKKAGKSDI